jgi:hypothetical protein
VSSTCCIAVIGHSSSARHVTYHLTRISASRFLRIYSNLLDDAGFVEEQPGFCHRAMQLISGLFSHTRSNSSALRLRRAKFGYLLVALLSSVAVAVYLLVLSIQGHANLVLQTREKQTPDGLQPPLFGICHNIFKIEDYNIVVEPDASESQPLRYETSNFIDLTLSTSPLFYNNKSTGRLLSRYSPSHISAAPSCFYHNLLPQLIGDAAINNQYLVGNDILENFTAFQEYNSKGLWTNCAVCYAPTRIRQSLNMRFDFALPELAPAGTFFPDNVYRVLPDNVYNFLRMKYKVFLSAPFYVGTGFFGQLNCSNAAKCGARASLTCCLQHLYDPVAPSTLTFGSVDLYSVPSSVCPAPLQRLLALSSTTTTSSVRSKPYVRYALLACKIDKISIWQPVTRCNRRRPPTSEKARCSH